MPPDGWNVFDDYDPMYRREQYPKVIRYHSVVETKRGLVNDHRIPMNDGFDHTATVDCECQPTKTGDEIKSNGVFWFYFTHNPQGAAR